MIITIDGPVATGKSTIAKELANAIGFIYYDTGAMYRALTYAILQANITMEDEKTLEKFFATFNFEIKIKRGKRCYLLNGEDITEKIRMEAVTSQVSQISANGLVRQKMLEFQRELAQGVNAVFEGRDMGSIIFPKAELKIFLTGNNEIRAKRRFQELKNKFPEENKDLTLEKAMEDILTRDSYDSKRALAPLVKPENAFEIDTSYYTVDEIVYLILEYKDTLKLPE